MNNPDQPSSVAIAVNGNKLDLNPFVATIVANMVDAIIDSLKTEGEIHKIVITRVR
jgi:hypothetical protein